MLDKETLEGLEHLNQLSLSEEQEAQVRLFFQARAQEWEALSDIDTADVERMVHVMPMVNVLREDRIDEPFERDDLQADAPDAMDGYWQVPYVME